MSKRFAVLHSPAPFTEKVQETADEALSNVFSFYGEKHRLPDHVDWTFNPGTSHWGHDLNRFTFLGPLTSAYLQTGDDRYARKCIELILSWIEQSQTVPYVATSPAPYLWSSYLNQAIHLIHWVECLSALDERDPALIADADYEVVLDSIESQLRWLDEVIPTHRNNWIQIGCRGVLVTLAYLSHFTRAREWSERAWQRMNEALQTQLLPDGVQDELTVHYHFAVVMCVFDALELADRTPTPPPEQLFQQVASMLHYLRQTIVPGDRYIVAFNDSDPEHGDVTRRLLDRPLAQRLLAETRRPLRSECFPYAGVMILREGEEKGRDELYAAFDGGPWGTAHQHEDKLGLWLAAFGRSFLVDPGRHLYDRSDVSFWPLLKSTHAHSTVTIDGEGQNSRAARDVPGAWRSHEPQPLLFETCSDGSAVAGAFYDLGYGEAKIPVVHFRLLFFFRELCCWAIIDRVDGVGQHTIDSRFQFAPGSLVTDDSQGPAVQTQFSDANLRIQGRMKDWHSVRVACGESRPRAGWFSPGINRIEPAPSAVFSTVLRALPWQGHVVLSAFRGSEHNPDVIDEVFRRASESSQGLLARLRALQVREASRRETPARKAPRG